MKSRWILNLGLALLVSALALLVYFKPGSEDLDTPPPLTTLHPDTITRLRVERRDKDTLVLEKIGGVWRMHEPVRARASPINMTSLLRLATARSEFTVAADPAILGKYGLDKPAARVWLNDEQIVVGAAHPIESQHYVLYGNTVHLIATHTLSAAFFNYGQLIDTRLLEEGRKLTGLRLPGINLERKDGAWRRIPGSNKTKDDTSTDRYNDFASDWEYARALAVARRSKKPVLDRIQLTFDENGKSTALTLDVLSYKPVFVLARADEGLEYHFPEETGKRLLNLDAAKSD